MDECGNFTYICTSGTSVIDYLLLSEQCFDLAHNFKVHDFNEWSDHSPLSFVIPLPCPISNVNKRCTKTSIRWNDDLKTEFRRQTIGQLPSFNHIVHNVNLTCKQGINDYIRSFTDTFVKVANPLFCETVSYTDKPFVNSLSKKSEWFDEDCYLAKKAYTDALTNYNRCNSNDNRNKLCHAKTAYKRFLLFLYIKRMIVTMLTITEGLPL